MIIKEKNNIIYFIFKSTMIQKKQVDSDSGSSNDDETVEDLMDVKKLKEMKKDKPMRTSVSAEAYG